jgi:hypothetical protein
MILVPLLLAQLAAAPPDPQTIPPSPSLLGSGLITLPDTRTLPRGRFDVSTTLYNRDRDPLGLDVFDYGLAFAAGWKPRMEAYGSLVFSRVVVVPDQSGTWPALPPPPIDLVLPDGMAVPARPYYAITPTFPFANGRGDERFSDLVPGDFVLGVKRRLRDADDTHTGYAVAGEIKLPLTRRLNALQSGSGTGGIDLTARAIAQRRFEDTDIITSAALVYVGRTHLPDRVLMANPGGAAVVEEPLRLPSRLELGVGLRHPVSPRVALVGEAVATMEIYGAKTLDRVVPLDLLLGLQGRPGRARITTAILYAAGSPPSGIVRPSPLAGYVDLTRSSLPDTRRYLEDAGLGGASAQVRPGVQIVTPRAPGAALPEGARVIPDTYTIISLHQLGLVFLVGWTF